MNLLGNAPYFEKQRGKKKNLASGIDRSIGIPERDGACKSFGGKHVLSHKAPINAGDVSSAIYFSDGVDNSKGLFIGEEGD